MSPKINLQFSCPVGKENLRPVPGGFHCDQCAKKVTDFTGHSTGAIATILKSSNEAPCGVFTRSQLSRQFLKYAATSILVSATSLGVHAQTQVEVDSLPVLCEPTEEVNDIVFGTFIENPPAPIGGLEKFFDSLSKAIVYPKGLTTNGRVYIEFVVDITGTMTDFKVVKGYHPLADSAALAAFTSINYPFTPGMQRGKPVRTRMVLPVTFKVEDEK